MKFAAVLLLGCALFAAVLPIRAGGGGDDDATASLPGVVDLTPDNMATEHNGRRAALIEFYAPWCGHCKRLVPEYTRLGEMLAQNPKLRSRVLVAKLDADKHRELGEPFGIKGFPTLKWFPRGKAADPVDYNGGRTAEDFLKFIEEQVSADAGFARVDALVPLAQKFAAASAADKAAVLAEATTAAADVSEDDKDNAALYLRYMAKALEKGEAYVAAELERLTKMSEKPMSAAKLDEISRKISVLSSFTEEPEAPAAAAKGKQAAGDDDDDEIEWDEADPEADDEADEEEEDEEDEDEEEEDADEYADGDDDEEDDEEEHEEL